VGLAESIHPTFYLSYFVLRLCGRANHRVVAGIDLLTIDSMNVYKANLLFIALLFGSFTSVFAESADERRVVREPYGAIVRGDLASKKLALVFTGDERGESTGPILDILKQRDLHGAFFVTGNFLRDAELNKQMRRALAEGHYVGPHSDSHLLYCAWDERDKSLVSKEDFKADLRKNLVELEKIDASYGDRPMLFIPPYEWYNREQFGWCHELGLQLINFTPGSGSNRDYAPEGNSRFVPSRKIYDDILAYEQKDPAGLNGFVLLLHAGSGRKDPFHNLLGELCDELQRRGYQFVRVDALLQGESQ
jgi:peptidoglycan/xylan/chitin deacetylase (PgdA/CDA1 family)